MGIAFNGSGRAKFFAPAASSVALIALLPVLGAAPAFAQDAAQTETIEVTGTRIKEPNVVAPSPITTVGSQELKLEGTVNVENMLNNLPSVTADQTSGVSNGATGTATVDLRGIGPDRTLVLIDGKRLGPGDAKSGASAADLNFIPGQLVDRVDVLTGGASTDYGSDAVAGVVNFKLKNNFEGVEIDQFVSAAQHDQHSDQAKSLAASSPYPVQLPGAQFDGVTRETSMIFGVNGAGGKANITMYLTDVHLDPILESARDWSSCSTSSTFDNNGNAIGHVCAGSSTTPYGRTESLDVNNTPASLQLNPNGTATYVPFSDAYRYNYGPLNYLQREDQRYTGGALAHYEIADWAEIYGSVMMLDDRTQAQLAGSGLFFGDTFAVNCNNPLMSAQQAPYLGCTPGGNDTHDANLLVGLRFINQPRQDNLGHTDYRFQTGVRGEFYRDWTYDLSLNYWKSNYSEVFTGDVSLAHIADALEVVNVNGVPTCKSGGSCVPLNIFQLGGVSQAAFNYLTVPSLSSGGNQETVVNADISGDFGQWGIKSPLASDPISTAFGYEYRFENLTFTPDNEFQTGDLAGQGGPTPAVAGSFDVNEFYGEFHVPVVQDLPWAKAIDLDAGIRHGGYQVYGTPNTFNTNSWKAQGDYQPIPDVRFRGGFNRAERAPNTEELFAPAALGTVSGSDPCSGSTPQASLAACEKSGVTPAEYGNIANCSAGQCSGLYGGNTALKPEVASTWTWGAVFSPTELPGLTASIDYWDIQVDHYIESAATVSGSIISACLGGSTVACSYIHRAPGSGLLFGNAGYIDAGEVNAGTLHTTGIDFAVGYGKDLEDFGLPGAGKIKVDFLGTLTESLVNPFLLGGNYDCAGLYGTTCGSPQPTWRHKARLTWDTPWNALISLDWRHISGVQLDNNSSNPILAGGYTGVGAVDVVDAKIPSFDYFDLAATWQVRQNLELRVGVNNLFDKDPPIIASDLENNAFLNGNTFPGTYDTLGRVIYVGINAKF